VSAPVAGTGVEFDSSDFDADDGSGCVMVGAGSRVLMFGVEADVFRDEVLEPDTIRARASGATLRVTILVFREPLGVALAGVAIMEDEDLVSIDMARSIWAVAEMEVGQARQTSRPGAVGGC
jgi:hypothetical protein